MRQGMVASVPSGIHGVVVAEQQDGLLLGLAGEINLQVIAEVGHAMELRASAEGGEFLGHKCADAVDGLLVIAG